MNDNIMLNGNISVLEVKQAVKKAKRGKACGIDGIPAEALKNDCTVSFLHGLFNVCFETGITPNVWGKNIITPIPRQKFMIVGTLCRTGVYP